jgi:ATP-dependent RNA helicase DeaD
MKKLRFDEFDLSGPILKAIVDMGFEEASPIQSETIPHLLLGKDIIGHAQTGTGKTAAFAIPTIENIEEDKNELQAIVLCPTRELVIQVSEEFRKLMKYKKNIEVVPVYGGQEIERQLRALKRNPQIVIGTPGRTMDHIRRGTIKMESVRIVILDEADEMLDMGFRDDIEVILKDTPKTRQTVMFSATMPSEILKLMKLYQKSPMTIDVSHQKMDSPKIEQQFFEIQEKAKPEALARLIDLYNIKLSLVFCNTRAQVDNLVEHLKSRGYFADGLHGDMNQRQRDKVMSSFRTGTIEILVATDVAGRGIDVNDIEAVFNYDLPQDDEDYIHRIGRTGRAGKTGIAFTFVVGKQIYGLKRIERSNGLKIIRKSVPTIDDLDETRVQHFANQVEAIIKVGHLGKYINMVEKLIGDEYTSLDVAAALLKMEIDKKNDAYDKNTKFENEYRDEPRRYDNNNRSGGFKPKRDGAIRRGKQESYGSSKPKKKFGENSWDKKRTPKPPRP